MCDIGFFACAPRWFGYGISVTAIIDDGYNRFSEALPNFLASNITALVLDSVVQKGGNCFIFVSASFEDNCGDCEQMRDVRYVATFAFLPGVETSCKNQGLLKTYG